MESAYLIVGLGNPGSEYARTRHNAGFLVVDRLARRWQASWSEGKKFSARLARTDRDGRKLLLCQPLTYMNASGEAVRALVDYYQIPFDQLLVVMDDADLPLGEIRLRPGGSTGGHHGLESIEQHLSTRAYPRLRIGIGRTQTGKREITDHVLSQFHRDEVALAEKALDRAADQVECWLREGIANAMSRFNGAVTS
jgi:peptidyl-tRNA hydrolase, PTH1 family